MLSPNWATKQALMAAARVPGLSLGKVGEASEVRLVLMPKSKSQRNPDVQVS